jgi:AcrR family transcriptional regulator
LLYGCAVLVQRNDLTARARIRDAALELFAQAGVGSTSMRSVAARAGVSPSLVVHHFRTKAGLRDAVDEAVVNAFGEALHAVDLSGSPHEVAAQFEVVLSGLIGENQSLRDYLARSLLEATPAGHRLFGALLDLVDTGLAALDANGHLAPGSDPVWRSYTATFIIFGPVLLHRQIAERLGSDPFAPDVVRARSACNLDVLRRGLFRD